jgi:hypothetical protein
MLLAPPRSPGAETAFRIVAGDRQTNGPPCTARISGGEIAGTRWHWRALGQQGKGRTKIVMARNKKDCLNAW